MKHKIITYYGNKLDSEQLCEELERYLNEGWQIVSNTYPDTFGRILFILKRND